MICDDILPLLMAYLDSELDVRSNMEVGEHLGLCEACCRRFAAEAEVERGLLAPLHEEAMPEEVWVRIQITIRRVG